MKKNVIYTIDCLWEDEWHNKNSALNRLIKDRLHITDDHIKSIFSSNWPSDDQKEWGKYTKMHMEIYAEKVKADLIVLNNSHAEELVLPDTWTNYQRSNLLKFYAMKDFLKSNYENFLCLDLDVLVSLKSLNIFKKFCSGFRMMYDGYEKSIHSCSLKLKNHFNLNIEFHKPQFLKNFDKKDRLEIFQNNMLYNGGVIFSSRKELEVLSKYIPENKDWYCFLKERNFLKNPYLDSGCEVNDQDFIQVFLRQSGIKAHPLGIEWNSDLNNFHDAVKKRIVSKKYFFHLFSGPEKCISRNLLFYLKNKNSFKKLNFFSELMDNQEIKTFN